MIDAESTTLFDRFVARTLPKSEWDHRAHLVVCWVTLASMEPADAIDFLRSAIRDYNEATGVANTTTSGYHETLTRYYVGAVAELEATSIDDVLPAPTCQVGAPLEQWSRNLLFSVEARAGWVEPDLAGDR